MNGFLRTSALLAACAVLLISSSALRRAPHAHAASPEEKPQTSQAPVVREIDVEGLKKLLSRDGGKPGRPLLVNFWATWCEPCRAEFPDLVKINNEYRGRGLDFITVSLDDASEINTTVPRFLKEMRASMPAYLLNTLKPEEVIQFVDPGWSGSLPATFLYDAQGKVVFNQKGRIKPLELRAAIEAVVVSSK